jgi:tetratricopeptide (TPR) repeat protein
MRLSTKGLCRFLAILAGVVSAQPVTSLPKQSVQQQSVPKHSVVSALESIRYEAAQGFDAPFYKEWVAACDQGHQGHFVVALDLVDKALAKRPDCLYLHFQRAQFLHSMGATKRSTAELEKALKMAEAAGDHYRDLYDMLADAYATEGNKKGLAELLEKMAVIFPHSRPAILQNLLTAYRHTGDRDRLNQTVLRLQQLGKSSPLAASPLLTVQPSGKDRLPPGVGYEFLARTEPYARFKLTLNQIMCFGETGTAQYVDLPPNYDQVVVVSPESHNCLKIDVDKLLVELLGAIPLQPQYADVKVVGRSTVGFIPCIQYKCQWQDDSSFDLITVARDLTPASGMVQTMAKLCGGPPSNSVVVGLCRVQGGFPRPILQTYSVKKVKFDEDRCRAVANFHQMKNLQELIYADEGDMKAEDTKKFLRSR